MKAIQNNFSASSVRTENDRNYSTFCNYRDAQGKSHKGKVKVGVPFLNDGGLRCKIKVFNIWVLESDLRKFEELRERQRKLCKQYSTFRAIVQANGWK